MAVHAFNQHSGGRGRQIFVFVSSRPGLSTEIVQDSQGYSERPCLETNKQTEGKFKPILLFFPWSCAWYVKYFLDASFTWKNGQSLPICVHWQLVLYLAL